MDTAAFPAADVPDGAVDVEPTPRSDVDTEPRSRPHEGRGRDRDQDTPVGGCRADVAAGAGRLARRWVPETLLTARWDAGRSGALGLTVVAALAAVIAAVGVWWQRPIPESVPALPLVASSTLEAPSTAAAGQVVVSVVGRVQRPGLVTLPDGARVADAIAAVGGALPDTDLTALNLARRLADGEQVIVGVPVPAGVALDGGVLGAVPGVGGQAPTAGMPPVPGALVDLNTATAAQLDALPGVGPVTVQRILDWRTANGRFTDVGQLREIDGIGDARFAQLRELVRV